MFLIGLSWAMKKNRENGMYKDYYLLTEIYEYHDETDYILYFFVHEFAMWKADGIYYRYGTMPSGITRTIPRTEFFDPSLFIKEFGFPELKKHIISIPAEMPFSISRREWKSVESTNGISAYDQESAEIIRSAAEEGKYHVLILNEKSHSESVSSADRKREDIIINDRYDEYYYDRIVNGNYWCLGHSMKEDYSRECEDEC